MRSTVRSSQKQRRVRIQAAIVHGSSVLLVKHRKHGTGQEFWQLPGGGPEGGECDRACLAREVEEETHLRVVIERMLFDDVTDDDPVYPRIKTYLCRPPTGTAVPGSEPEVDAMSAITETGWVALTDETGWDPLIISTVGPIHSSTGWRRF